MDYVPVSEEKASKAQLDTIKELCKKHKINLNSWCERNGKTVDDLTAMDIGVMLKALKGRYGDE